MRILVTGSNGLLGQKLVELMRSDPTVELVATARQIQWLEMLLLLENTHRAL